MACLHVARSSYAAGEFAEAVRVLDMGLIMGGMAMRKDLESAIEKAAARVRVSDGGAEARCLVVPREFDGAEEVRSILPNFELPGVFGSLHYVLVQILSLKLAVTVK